MYFVKIYILSAYAGNIELSRSKLSLYRFHALEIAFLRLVNRSD